MTKNKFFCNKCDLHLKKEYYGYEDKSGDEKIDFLFVSLMPNILADCLGSFLSEEYKNFLEQELLSGIREDPFNYLSCSCVFCKPYDENNKPRVPNHSEILKCSDNFIMYVYSINPKLIIFTDSMAAKFYKKEFKNSISINSIETIIKQGGKGSPLFSITKRILKESLQCI